MTAAKYDADPTAAAVLIVTGSVSTVTETDGSTTATFRVPLTAAQTASLEPSPIDAPVNWVIQVRAVTSDARKQTEFVVAATVERAIIP